MSFDIEWGKSEIYKAQNKLCLLRKYISGVTPVSSTGLEPGAPRQSGFQGGGRHPDLSCPGALFVQFARFRILLLNCISTVLVHNMAVTT